jgi:hypothetical protein
MRVGGWVFAENGLMLAFTNSTLHYYSSYAYILCYKNVQKNKPLAGQPLYS